MSARRALRRASCSRRDNRRFIAEPLERRLLLTVSAPGIPTWISEGPAPITDGGGNVIGPTPATTLKVGADNMIAVDPANSKHLLVASVNGGIWQTGDFTAASPVWTTTTDRMPSLAIDSIAFSPVSSSVIYAGTGSYSSLGPIGGRAVGVYKSVDGGATWQVLNPFGIFTGLRIMRIVPTTLNGGQTVFAATTDGGSFGGVFRSDDGGASWSRLSGANGLPSAGVTDLVENPANPNQFFAATSSSISGSANAGVYRLDVGVSAVNWVNVTNNMLNGDLASSQRIELSISSAGTNPVWASIINGTGFYQRIYRGVASGGTVSWSQVGPSGLPPDVFDGNQGSLHGAIVADPASDNLIFVAGDRNVGSNAYIARGNSTTSTWTAITPNGNTTPHAGTVIPTSNSVTTSPHADTRNLVFASGGVLLLACDGGVYQGINPASTSPGAQVWTSINGNIQDTEFYSLGYDSQFHILFGGTQDNGTPSQNSPGSISSYNDQSGGDGGASAVDNFTRAGLGGSVRYFFNVVRKWFTSATGRVAGDNDPNILPLTGPASLTSTNQNDLVAFTAVNAIAPTAAQLAAGQSTRVLVAGTTNPTTPVGALFESNNAGSAPQISMIVGGVTRYFVNDTWTAIPTGAGFVRAAAVAYGGRSGGVNNPDLLYAVSGSSVFLRTTAGGTLTATSAQPAGAGTLTSIAIDPNNWQTAFVTDGTSVYMTTIAGAAWTNVTGNLNPATGTGGTAILTTVGGAGGNCTLLFGLANGIRRMQSSAPSVWSTYGSGLPNTVVGGMTYNAADDVLVIATFGRGAWEINGVSGTINVSGQITITGSGLDDIYVIGRDGTGLTVDETLGGGPTTHYEFDYGAVTALTINTQAGNDAVTVNAAGGDPVPSGGISYDGGTDTSGDSFALLGSAGGDVIHEANSIFNINFSANVSAVNIERVNLNGAAGDDVIDVDAANIPNTIGGGGNDDTINLALASQNLDGISAPINVPTDSGNDQVVLWDSSDAFADTYTFSPGSVARPFFGGLTYAFGIEGITFHGGPLGDTYNVSGVLLASALTLLGGGGADTFNLSPAAHDYANNAGAALTVNGGSGSDTLTLNDQATAFDDNWTISSTTIDKANAFPSLPLLAYSGLEGITLNGGDGGTTYSIQSCSTPLTLNAGGGNDEVDVGTYGSGNLDFISAPISVDGGAGASNNIFIEDTANTFANSWSLGFNSVIRSAFGGLSFLDFNTLILDAGSGGTGSTGSLFTVNAVGVTRVFIAAGSKNDTFNIGNGVALAAPLFSTLSIDGGGSSGSGDALNLLDQSDTLDTAYTITSSQITRAGSSPILYANLESISVRAGSGSNPFSIVSTAAGAPVTLFGGPGSDAFNVTSAGLLSALLSDVTADGETGANDQMTVSDVAYSGILGQAFYTVTASEVQGTFTPMVHYANLDGVTLNTSNVISDVNLTGTAAGTPVTINGDAGADILTVAGAGLNSDVTYDGGEPTASPGDSLVVNGGGLSGSYLPSGTTTGDGVVKIGPHHVTFRKLEPVTVSSFAAFTLQTPNSADSISITSGPSGNTATGSSGGVPFESLTWSTVTSFVLDLAANEGVGGGSPNDNAVILSPGLSVPAGSTFLFKGGVGSDKLIVNAGSYTFDQDAQLYTASLSLVANSGAAIRFNASQHLAALILNSATAELASGGSRVISTPALSITGTGGLLDLTNNQLLITNTAFTPASVIRGYLLSAYAGGAWTGGSGITSSNAIANPVKITVAYADGNDLSSQDARPDIAAGTLLVRPTLVGDANLDGTVDFFDITQVLGYKYNAPVAASYTDGDLDYSGQVDFFDLSTLLSANYNTGTTFPSPASGASTAASTATAAPSGIPPSGSQATIVRKKRAWHPW